MTDERVTEYWWDGGPNDGQRITLPGAPLPVIREPLPGRSLGDGFGPVVTTTYPVRRMLAVDERGNVLREWLAIDYAAGV